MNHKEAMIKASGYYLSNPLKFCYTEWTDDELDKWLEDNAWEPFAQCEGAELYDLIRELATDFMDTAKQGA